jgi:ribosomal protein S18 acetylase RimI-like enzyme
MHAGTVLPQLYAASACTTRPRVRPCAVRAVRACIAVIALPPVLRAGRVWIMLELRTVEPDDWPIWRELRLAALAEAPYAFGSTLAEWTGAGDREERWRARLEIPGARDVVVLLDGLPVGMASGVPADEGTSVELISMWVGPVARGRGVGDLLIAAVEGWAVERQARTLRLSVMPDNGTAIALYERHGFADTGELGDLLPDGVRRERVMAKIPGPVPDENR